MSASGFWLSVAEGVNSSKGYAPFLSLAAHVRVTKALSLMPAIVFLPGARGFIVIGFKFGLLLVTNPIGTPKAIQLSYGTHDRPERWPTSGDAE